MNDSHANDRMGFCRSTTRCFGRGVPVGLVLGWAVAGACGCTRSVPDQPAPNSPTVTSPEKPSPTPAVEKPVPADPITPRSQEPAPPAKPAIDVTELRKRLEKLTFRSATGWTVSQDAVAELEKLGTDSSSHVAALLTDESVDVRRGAIFYLIDRFEPNDPRHVEAFLAATADRDATISLMALQGVTRLPEDVLVSSLPRLTSQLGASPATPSHRAAVARLIGNLGPAARTAFDAVAKSARGDAEPSVRSASLMAASKIGAPEQLVPVLREVLKSDREARVRVVAAARLRELGLAAAPAAPELAAALADESTVRDAAVRALPVLGAGAVAAVVTQLDAKEATTRRWALVVLAQFGDAAREAKPAIERRRSDPDEEVRMLAERILARWK